ncbi:MAG: ATP-binding protein [Gammaproteobacteria bacterium]
MLGSKLGASLDERGLKLVLALFLLALAVPTAVLIWQAWSQLKWEALHQQRLVAEDLAARIDARQIELIREAEAHSFADYRFLVVEGDPSANFLQRSPLSGFPVEAALPGLVGWFQIDAEGRFSTPLLPPEGVVPKTYGISDDELQARIGLERQIRDVLSENRLVKSEPVTRDVERPVAMRDEADTDERSLSAPQESARQEAAAARGAPTGSEYFDRAIAEQASDRSGIARESESKDELDYAVRPTASDAISGQRAMPPPEAELPRAKRKEQTVVAEPVQQERRPALANEASEPAPVTITTFESEIDPFEFSLLDSGHFVLYRTAWRDGQRYIQGAIIEQRPFLEDLIGTTFVTSALHRTSDLIVGYGGRVLSFISGASGATYSRSPKEVTGEVLLQTRLSAPLDSIGLSFHADRLPAGPGARVLGWITLILALVFTAGFYALYRAGLAQIRLTRQQQDFVSAVSHELKTPLTSIRMYGEMLKKGWADAEKRQAYYEYIHDESERLSRLISNVLQLARLTRSDPQMDLRPVTVAEVMDQVRSKIESHVEQAGFELRIERDPDADKMTVELDTDCFVQIVINLVDNAVKFSANAERKAIEIASRLQGKSKVVFSVRDYGPGIPKEQMRRIFGLFYRGGKEVDRAIAGTGIGLALVDQLARAMGGKVDVLNQTPGAEFRVVFPVAAPGLSGG